MSQEKKAADYASGTYFIHPKLIEEMRQSQRQKHQPAREQRGVTPEQPSASSSQKTLQDTSDKRPGEQANRTASKLTDTPTSQTNPASVQPEQK